MYTENTRDIRFDLSRAIMLRRLPRYGNYDVCTGIGIAELAIGGPSGSASVADEYDRARRAYAANEVRKAKARAISATR